MNKGQVIGLVVTGLAVIGGVAVYNWVRKPKKNSEGFFNASGRTGKATQKWCAKRNADGSVQYATSMGSACPKGWQSVTGFGDREGV